MESGLVSGKPLAANGAAPDVPLLARLDRVELLLSSFPSVGNAYGEGTLENILATCCGAH